jgi:hypothetical protein
VPLWAVRFFSSARDFRELVAEHHLVASAARIPGVRPRVAKGNRGSHPLPLSIPPDTTSSSSSTP